MDSRDRNLFYEWRVFRPAKAITAMTHKLARLVYRMLRYGMKYVDQGAVFFEAQHRRPQIKQLKWKAQKLGFRIIQASAA